MLNLASTGATPTPKMKCFALLHKALLLTNTSLRTDTQAQIEIFRKSTDVAVQRQAVQKAADALAPWGFPQEYRDQVVLRSLMPERAILGATTDYILDDYTGSGCTAGNVEPGIAGLARL